MFKKFIYKKKIYRTDMESETTSIGFSMWITKQQRRVKFYQRLHVSLQRCNNLLSKSKSGSSEAAYKHSNLLTDDASRRNSKE